MADELDLGDWNAACSMCGKKYKASTLVQNWQGMYRCPEHNEARHPQDYVRAVPDVQTPPWTQPEADAYTAICFPLDVTGVADYAVADCAICDYISLFLINITVPKTPPVSITMTPGGVVWTPPADWNPTNNTIKVTGGGGNGQAGTLGAAASGGGGGAYSENSNVSLVIGINYLFTVGTGGTFTDSYFGGASVATSIVGAKGASGTNPGSSILSVGARRLAGGAGGVGHPTDLACGGGGGAANTNSPGGVGGNGASGLDPIGGGGGGAGGTSGTAFTGGVPGGGAGGIVSGNPIAGSAGGGGGGGVNGQTGAAGGLSGGGGGGGQGGQGLGAAGSIVITYVPI